MLSVLVRKDTSWKKMVNHARKFTHVTKKTRVVANISASRNRTSSLVNAIMDSYWTKTVRAAKRYTLATNKLKEDVIKYA